MTKNYAENIKALLDEFESELLDAADKASSAAEDCDYAIRHIEDGAFGPFIHLICECSDVIKENYGLTIQCLG